MKNPLQSGATFMNEPPIEYLGRFPRTKRGGGRVPPRFAAALLVCLLVALAPGWTLAGETLTIGRPTKQVQKDFKRLIPIADYLGARLGAVGITGGEVLVSGMNSTEECIGMLQTGKLDLVFETPASALRMIKEAGARPLLPVTRDGVSQYSSLVFVRDDSGLTALTDLRNKIVAFEDPGSTSGFFLPRKAMLEAGLELVPLASPETPVPPGKTGYVFAQGELNVSSWVFFRKAHAGAMANTDWLSQEDNPEAFRARMRILHETVKVPRMLVLVGPGMSPVVEAELKRLLLAMPSDPVGREALKGYKLDGFTDHGPPETLIQQLEKSLAGN